MDRAYQQRAREKESWLDYLINDPFAWKAEKKQAEDRERREREQEKEKQNER